MSTLNASMQHVREIRESAEHALSLIHQFVHLDDAVSEIVESLKTILCRTYDLLDDEEDAEEVRIGAMVHCLFCHEPTNPDTAHAYQGGYVGDRCCWDERLRSSE